MRRAIVWGLLAAAILFTGCRGGEQGADRPGQGQRAAATIGGVVTSLEGDRVAVTSLQGERVEMEISEDTQIMFDENPVGREAIEPGANVRATYRTQGQSNRAERIDIDAPADTPPSPSIVPGTQGMESPGPEPRPGEDAR